VGQLEAGLRDGTGLLLDYRPFVQAAWKAARKAGGSGGGSQAVGGAGAGAAAAGAAAAGAAGPAQQQQQPGSSGGGGAAEAPQRAAQPAGSRPQTAPAQLHLRLRLPLDQQAAPGGGSGAEPRQGGTSSPAAEAPQAAGGAGPAVQGAQGAGGSLHSSSSSWAAARGEAAPARATGKKHLQQAEQHRQPYWFGGGAAAQQPAGCRAPAAPAARAEAAAGPAEGSAPRCQQGYRERGSGGLTSRGSLASREAAAASGGAGRARPSSAAPRLAFSPVGSHSMHSAGSGPGGSISGLLQRSLGAAEPPPPPSPGSGGLQRPSSAPAARRGAPAGAASGPLGGGSAELPFGRERHLSVPARRELQQLRDDLDTVRELR
jgi:hypothetical protein